MYMCMSFDVHLELWTTPIKPMHSPTLHEIPSAPFNVCPPQYQFMASFQNSFHIFLTQGLTM
jgi:hypothetical protein